MGPSHIPRQFSGKPCKAERRHGNYDAKPHKPAHDRQQKHKPEDQHHQEKQQRQHEVYDVLREGRIKYRILNRFRDREVNVHRHAGRICHQQYASLEDRYDLLYQIKAVGEYGISDDIADKAVEQMLNPSVLDHIRTDLEKPKQE